MIYLDHNATTPILPEVLEAMWPFFAEKWGNSSSSYRFGSQLKGTLEKARGQVAALVGASAREIIFTGNATESNNTAMNAALSANPNKRHLITSKVEHSAVLSYAKYVEKNGVRVTYLDVDRDGLLNLAQLESAICDETALVSLMWANNETGVLFPMREIGELCRAQGVLFHCDAVQAAGKLAINVADFPVDYLALSGHKFGAAKGVGALYVHRKVPFSPFLHGGHQERGRRGGTENIALIAGMGVAAELALPTSTSIRRSGSPFARHLGKWNFVLHSQRHAQRPRHRAINEYHNISFDGIEAEALLLLLDGEGICASSGSACLADSDETSHVLCAMKPETNARCNVRFSLGPTNTREEVETTVEVVRRAVRMLRG